jgi:hypothetical protein
MILADPGTGPAMKKDGRLYTRRAATLPIELVAVAYVQHARIIGLDFRIE